MTDAELIDAYKRLVGIHATFVTMGGQQPSQELLREYMLLTEALVAELRVRDPESAARLDNPPVPGAGFDLEGVVGRLVRRIGSDLGQPKT